MNKYAEALHLVREKEPLVQCITNFVTVNDCANIILAAGGSPSMAHDVREAAEAARNARALVCNMGAIEDAPSMILAGKEMNKLGRPVVLDPVAAGGTSLRREVAAELLKEVKFSSIRGNASEIRYLAGQQTAGSGVDVSALDKITEENLKEAAEMVRALAERTGKCHCCFRKAGSGIRWERNGSPQKWMCNYGADYGQRLYADFHDRCILRSHAGRLLYGNSGSHECNGNQRRGGRGMPYQKRNRQCYIPDRFD